MLLIVLVLSLPLLFLLYLHRKNNRSNLSPPPGPPGLPLIGNLHQLAAAKAPHVYLWQLSQTHGPIVQLKLGYVPTIVISSAKLAEETMRAQDLAFSGRPSFLGARKLTYGCMDMVFSPYGDHWRELRKITAVHLFSSKKTQSFRPIREDEVSRMLAKISSQHVVNLSEAATALGVALICRVAFGKSASEMRRFDGLLHDTQALLAGFFVSDYFPAFGWVDKLSGMIGRLDSVFNELDAFYQELIDEHVAKKTAGVSNEGHILDVLIQLKEDRACSIDLSWDIVKALLTDIFVGATDTSAASTVWTMTALIKAPRVMRKVQAEIRDLIGKKGVVDEDDLPKLPYLKAVINETFRLYPVAPLLVPRQTTTKCTLEGYEIQPNTLVYVNAWAIGRDPEYWKNNTYDFLPERFLDNNIDARGQDFGLVPFGSGRRVCPGMIMGLANVELTLANLLYSFDWELPDGIEAEDIDFDVLPGVTMHKKNALILVPNKYVI